MNSFDSIVALSGLLTVATLIFIGFAWTHIQEVKKRNGTVTRHH